MADTLQSDLMEALYNDDFETVKTLISQGANVNIPAQDGGYSPFLWVCAKYSDPEIIRLFLDNGADLNCRNNEGSTPLHILARKQFFFDSLALLIERGADVNAQDNDGWTPLMDAVHHPHAINKADLTYNLALLSDKSVKNNDGKTAYQIAQENSALDDPNLLELLKF